MSRFGRVLTAVLALTAAVAGSASAQRSNPPMGQLVGLWNNGDAVMLHGSEYQTPGYVAVGWDGTAFNGPWRRVAPPGESGNVVVLPHFAVWTSFSSQRDDEASGWIGRVAVSPLPTDAAPTTLSECDGEAFTGDAEGSPAAVATDADVVAWAQGKECLPTRAIHVRDLASGAPATTLRAPAAVTGLGLAGSAVGYTTATTAGVLDRTTGAALYSLSLPRGGRPRAVAVAADGTAAVLVQRKRGRASCGLELWLFSAVAPAGERRASKVCDVQPHRVGSSFLVVAEDSAGRSVLARLDPAGGVVPLAFIAPDTASTALIADDTRVAYTQRASCDGPATTFVDSVTTPDPAALARLECPIVLAGVRVTRKGAKRTLRATLTCPAGCAGAYSWHYPQTGASIDVDAEIETGDAHDFTLAPGESRTVSFTVRCTVPPRRHRIGIDVFGSLGARTSARRTFTCPRGSAKGEHVADER